MDSDTSLRPYTFRAADSRLICHETNSFGLFSRMNKRKVITIDGLAGSGKSSIASQLAQRLGFVHFNSGLLYRAVAHLVSQHGVSVDDEDAITKLIKSHRIELRWRSGVGAQLIIDEVVIDATQVSTPALSEITSQVSKHFKVREALLEMQRVAFAGHDLVAEGRDMGTVVFPAADLKFFVQADVAVRIERRMAQLALKSGNPAISKVDMQKEILERDQRDSARAVSPTIAASDAILIDNSSGSLNEVVEKIYQRALQKT